MPHFSLFPGLQSSFGQPNPSPNNGGFNPFGALSGLFGGAGGQNQENTPALPAGNPLAGLTPDQLRQLALLQYLQNPAFALAAFGGAGIMKMKSLLFGPLVPSYPIFATIKMPFYRAFP